MERSTISLLMHSTMRSVRCDSMVSCGSASLAYLRVRRRSHTPRHTLLAGQNHRHTPLVELRSSRTTDHLLQHGLGDLLVAAAAAPLLGALHDHQEHGQIHAQRQRGGRADHLHEAVLEQRLHEGAVAASCVGREEEDYRAPPCEWRCRAAATHVARRPARAGGTAGD